MHGTLMRPRVSVCGAGDRGDILQFHSKHYSGNAREGCGVRPWHFPKDSSGTAGDVVHRNQKEKVDRKEDDNTRLPRKGRVRVENMSERGREEGGALEPGEESDIQNLTLNL